ncbi:MAG: PAS domain-containing sensor histidine kinase [Ignavibacteriales bacterium]|nr:MAG: PAS domain-containing sensor histidine kinase [Ignavibacteriales bacterium]
MLNKLFQDSASNRNSDEYPLHAQPHNHVQPDIELLKARVEELEKKDKEAAFYKNLLQNLLDNVPDTIYFKDKDSRFILINRAQIYNLGVKTSEDAVGKTDFDYFTPDHAADAFDDEQKIIRTGIPLIDKSEKIRRADGEFRWVSSTKTPLYDIDKKIIGILGISRDITEKQKALESLQESEERYASLFQRSMDCVYLHDFQGNFLDANDAALNLLGYSKSEMRGLNFASILSPEQIPAARGIIEEIRLLGRQKERVEFQLRHKNGQIIEIEQIATIIYQSGKPFAIQGIARDITQRKKAERQLLKYAEELNTMNSNKNKLFSIIAHDLKSPFHGLLGVSGILANELQNLSADEVSTLTMGLHKSLQQQYDLVEKLLDWSRLQTGRIEYSPVITNLKKFAEESINSHALVAEEKKIVLVNDINDKVEAFADSYMLSCIFNNLVSNAIKFSKPGGQVKLSSLSIHSFIEVQVTDSGVGISQENLSKLFHLESNIVTTGTANEKGTGLGLLLCRDFIARHGGKIWVESKINEGSTFKFWLPKS